MDKKKFYEIENIEWLDSLEYIIQNEDSERVRELLSILQAKAQEHGILSAISHSTPYIK